MRLTILTPLAMLLILTPKVYAMSVAPKDPPKPPPSHVEKVAETTVVILSCPSNIPNADAMCTALETALQETASIQKIRRGDHAPKPGELAVTLHITRAVSNALEGYLEWQTQSSTAQTGPPVTLGVVDATITARMYDTFASGLVKVSKLPIH